MSIASFLEKTVIGDKHIKRDAQAMQNFGMAEFERGTGISGEGLDGVRASARTYSDLLASGRPLPASVYRAFSLLRGGIKDESARGITAVRETIANRRAATGGMMSAEAAAELARLGERDVRSKAFDTMRDVDVAQAQQELAATQDLFSRLDAARGRILNHGEFIQNTGSGLYQQGLLARMKRAMAIASAGTSGANTGMQVYGAQSGGN